MPVTEETATLQQSIRELVAKAKSQGGKFDELGVTGLQRYGGHVFEEYLKELRGPQAFRIYREMRDNDATVGSFLYAIEMISRNVDWRVEGKDTKANEFVNSLLDDMSQTFPDFIAEVLSMLTYGFAYHEIVYKRRMGATNNAATRSKYDDGKIGWRKLPIRSQDTIVEWIFDEDGGIKGAKQSALPTYQLVELPIERCLLFRVGVHKGNPEGRSLLRNCYRSWYMKKKIEEIEGIGVERDLAGLPVIYRTAEMAAMYDDDLKKIVRNVRRDEQEGLLLPQAFDDQGNPLLKFELVSSAGQRQFDTSSVINRYAQTIAMTVLADFLFLGQGKVGSFALVSEKTALFTLALGAVLKSIAAVLNRYALPRVFALNGWAPKEMPQLVPGDIKDPDLTQLGQWVSSMAQAGMPLFPDDNLENYLRKLANLPEKPEGQMPAIPGLPTLPLPPPEPEKPKLAAPIEGEGEADIPVQAQGEEKPAGEGR